MLRPNACIVPFEATGLPEEEKQADRYSTTQRIAAIEFAQVVAAEPEAHLGDPNHDLKHNLYRFDYVLGKFGITSRTLGVTAHGLRHEALIDEFVVRTDQQPPVRGGGNWRRISRKRRVRLTPSWQGIRASGHPMRTSWR